jgi:four helix bundle protein
MRIERFEDMEIWKEARELCSRIFEITSEGRFGSDYRFRDQVRASAGSVMDNIAEGFERGGNKELIQFLSIAKGSCGEVRSQVHRAYDFKYLSKDVHTSLIGLTLNLSKHISGFMTYLKNSQIKGTKYH